MIAIPLESRVAYLELVCDHYKKWWQHYAFINEINESTWFNFGLKIKTAVQSSPSPEGGEAKKEIIQPVLEALEQYANQKILISGSPGVGKSTLMAQIFLKFARRAQEDSTAPIPVLVELKSYRLRDGIWGLIQTSLEEYDLYLEVPEIKKLVAEKQLVLLMDGLNELPEESARTELESLCRRSIPLIVTTRDLGRNLSIDRKLEIQPLNPREVKTFLLERLPNRDRARVKELCDRVQDFGQTPLMVWMLYSVFSQKDEIPETRGEAYRAFTTLYVERAKEGIDLDESRFLLSKLAFEMMQSPTPTEFRLEITEVEAENLLTSQKVCKHLLSNHLLQWEGKLGNRQIRFCHQSLQEYYAAEALLTMFQEQHLDVIDDERFQHFYLNYLKWTESIALMLGLLKNQVQAVRVVELALEVDLFLGASLAGKVEPQYQPQTVNLIVAQKIEVILKVQLLGKTQSSSAISYLLENLEAVCEIRRCAANSLTQLGTPEVISILLKSPCRDKKVCQIFFKMFGEMGIQEAVPILAGALQDSDYQIRENAAIALGKLDSDELAISALINALSDPFPFTRIEIAKALGKQGKRATYIQQIRIITQGALPHSNPYICWLINHELGIPINITTIKEVVEFLLFDQELFWFSCIREIFDALGKSISFVVKPIFIKELDNLNSEIRRRAIDGLDLFGDEAVVHHLIAALQDLDWRVRWLSCSALGNIGEFSYNKAAESELLRTLDDENCYVRGAAAEALGKLKSQVAIPALVRIAINDDSNTRTHAAEALRAMSAESALPELISALKDPNWIIRSNAAHALGVLKHRSAISSLIRALEDPESLVHFDVAQALAELDCSAAIPKLLDSLRSPYYGTKVLAAETLCEMYAPEALSHLRKEYLRTLDSAWLLNPFQKAQKRCQFYNYEILQNKPELIIQPSERSPKYIKAEVVQIIENNHGTVNAKQNSKTE